jgi:hypothetical protein
LGRSRLSLFIRPLTCTGLGKPVRRRKVTKSSLACGGRENWSRAVAERPVRFDRLRFSRDGRSCPRCAADEGRSKASKDLAPGKRSDSNLRHRESNMIASKCSRQREQGRNDGTQDHGPCHCEGDLGDPERHSCCGDGNKRRAEHAGTTMVGPDAGIDRHKKGKA